MGPATWTQIGHYICPSDFKCHKVKNVDECSKITRTRNMERILYSCFVAKGIIIIAAGIVVLASCGWILLGAPGPLRIDCKARNLWARARRPPFFGLVLYVPTTIIKVKGSSKNKIRLDFSLMDFKWVPLDWFGAFDVEFGIKSSQKRDLCV